MPEAKIFEDICKGCELCVPSCPVKIIVMAERINRHGYHPAKITDQSKCIGCGYCYIMCPEPAIEIYKEDAKPAKK